jgi:hypothetical protein
MLKRTHDFFLKASIYIFVVIFILTNTFLGQLFLGVSEILNINVVDDNSLTFESMQEAFFITVIIVPVIETFLFQYLIFTILDYYKIDKKYIILISGIIFGFTHYYSPFYIFYTIIVGFLYAYIYLLCQLRKEYPFLIVLMIHGLYNFNVLYFF